MKPRINVMELLIPLAILFAGIVLAFAIYNVRLKNTVAHGTADPEAVRPITLTDHIIGKPGADVTIIEYADIDSSYSKSFQLTMEQLMTAYAENGNVAWVYRHFPLTTMHENAATHALAAECAASLSVPSTFFRFIDAMQAAAPGENQYNPSGYPSLVAQFGLNQAAFDKCMTAGAFTRRVHDDYDNALASGATGSPFVILLVHGQKPIPINGALPYAAVKKLVDQALTQTGH